MALQQELHVAQISGYFACRACGHQQPASITATGIGTGYLGTAGDNAVSDAHAMVPMLLSLKRCPNCGQRDERVAKRNVRTRTIAVAVIAVIGVATGVLVGAIFGGALGIGIGLGTAALMGGFAWVQHRMLSLRYPTDVEAMVTLVDQPMPTSQDAAGWKYL
jgi:hypothetical protein